MADTPKLAYSLDTLAELTELSKTSINEHIKSGNLVASYPNSKPIILADEAKRWLESLPNERAS